MRFPSSYKTISLLSIRSNKKNGVKFIFASSRWTFEENWAQRQNCVGKYRKGWHSIGYEINKSFQEPVDCTVNSMQFYCFRRMQLFCPIFQISTIYIQLILKKKKNLLQFYIHMQTIYCRGKISKTMHRNSRNYDHSNCEHRKHNDSHCGNRRKWSFDGWWRSSSKMSGRWCDECQRGAEEKAKYHGNDFIRRHKSWDINPLLSNPFLMAQFND